MCAFVEYYEGDHIQKHETDETYRHMYNLFGKYEVKRLLRRHRRRFDDTFNTDFKYGLRLWTGVK
jgi:hypothetical protein